MKRTRAWRPVVRRAGKFFVPGTDGPEEAEQHYRLMKHRCETFMGRPIGDHRIFDIVFTRDGRPYRSTVGRPDGETRETVLAILETQDRTMYSLYLEHPRQCGGRCDVSEFDS